MLSRIERAGVGHLPTLRLRHWAGHITLAPVMQSPAALHCAGTSPVAHEAPHSLPTHSTDGHEGVGQQIFGSLAAGLGVTP